MLYDGLCGLCNAMNRFVLARDRRAIFDFASLQSAVGRSWLRHFERNPDVLDTFYVVTGYRSNAPALVSKAAAALFVARWIGAPWRWLAVLEVVPTAWLDRAYDVIARHRYRLSARRETCLMPTAEYAKRFIDV